MAKEKAVEVAASTTIQVLETLCDKIGPVIKQVAASLGTSSEQIMTIFTKQVYADSIGNFMTAFTCLMIAFAWLHFSKIWFQKVEHRVWDNEGFVANIILSVFMYFTCAIVAASNIVYGVKRLINPEYYSFTEVLAKVTELIGK